MKKILCLILISFLFGGCGQEDEKQSKNMPKISIEHEDALMSPKEGLEKAVSLLKKTIIYEQPGQMWWA